MYRSPPTGPQGKTLTKSAPDRQAVTTSVGVKAPGSTTILFLAANSTISGFRDGAVIKLTPASMQRRALSTSITVPAPTITFGSDFTRWTINSTAPGIVIVISTIGMPLRVTASAAKCASGPEVARIAGIIAISLIRELTSSLVMVVCSFPSIFGHSDNSRHTIWLHSDLERATDHRA